MTPPEHQDTPVPPATDFGVEQNDHNELDHAESDGGNGAAGGPLDPWDIDAILAAFRLLPEQEQRERLVNLFVAASSENAFTRRDLANHKTEDRQEFAVINDELEYHAECLGLLMKHFDIVPPPRPKERPRRKQ